MRRFHLLLREFVRGRRNKLKVNEQARSRNEFILHGIDIAALYHLHQVLHLS